MAILYKEKENVVKKGGLRSLKIWISLVIKVKKYISKPISRNLEVKKFDLKF